jgi:hypothetical protein
MPLAPFIYGVVVGAAITYAIKDDPSKQKLKETGGKVSDGISNLGGKVTSVFQKTEEAASDKGDTAAA